MQKLLLLPLLALCHRRQIVVLRAAISLQILIRHGLEVNGLDVQVLESLGVGVDGLVDEFALDLGFGRRWPPDVFVEVPGDGFQESGGDVHVAALLEDFLVDERGYLFHSVFARAVELEGFGGGGVVVEHLLQGYADVDGVDGPELLLHPVGGDDVGGAG